MRLGQLRKRITIQSETSTPDGAGGYTLGWTNVATAWGEITPITGNEPYVAAHLEGHVTHHVQMRFQSGITTDMLMTYNSRLFKIRAVLNTDERNQWMELLVEEGCAT
jgi:SPP1 family predicted phage head-tail adaptor